jgi:hypothetical protein
MTSLERGLPFFLVERLADAGNGGGRVKVEMDLAEPQVMHGGNPGMVEEMQKSECRMVCCSAGVSPASLDYWNGGRMEWWRKCGMQNRLL